MAVNLKNAAKDTADIEQKLLKQSARIYDPQNIRHKLLTDTQAGKGGHDQKNRRARR
jgi:hypothetical protein